MEPEIEIKNAVIESASISYGDCGFLDVWLNLYYGGDGQDFGEFVLYLPKSFDHHEIKSFAGHHIYRILEVAGVTDWEKVVGRTIRVKATHGAIHAIGHIVKDDWFCPSEDYKQK